MSRFVEQEVSVTTRPDTREGLVPVSWVYRRGRYQVAEILDVWMETRRWWERETECQTFRVRDLRGGVWELSRMMTNPPTWQLYKAYD